MTLRERQPASREERTSSPEPTDTPQYAEARETGDAFLAAADAAIEQALSASPEEFLLQNRQLGGQ